MGELDLDSLERRSEPRRDSGNEVALLDLGEGREPVSCCIWNISASGACLMIPPDLALPKHFHVQFDTVRHRAVEVWRQWSHVGVKFED